MTLATVSGTTSSRRVGLRRATRTAIGIDALLMGVSLATCAAFFFSGGLEAFAFAVCGAVLGVRNSARGQRLEAAYSAGFAGLFVGAIFAAFFHGALATAVQLIS